MLGCLARMLGTWFGLIDIRQTEHPLDFAGALKVISRACHDAWISWRLDYEARKPATGSRLLELVYFLTYLNCMYTRVWPLPDPLLIQRSPMLESSRSSMSPVQRPAALGSDNYKTDKPQQPCPSP